jgi:hypothetical protein
MARGSEPGCDTWVREHSLNRLTSQSVSLIEWREDYRCDLSAEGDRGLRDIYGF